MIDVTQQLGAVRRQVGTRQIEAGQAHVVTVSQTYACDLADLWDACTNPDRIPRWFLPVTGDLRLGGRYQIQGHAGGTIESCDPPHGFTATWEFGDETTWIDVRLTPEADGRTRLQIEHIAQVDDERWTQFGPGAVGVGWDMMLMGLAIHLSSGQPVNRQESAAWAASEQGARFVTLSSEDWCLASIAAGTDRAAAQEAASRTTAFYHPNGAGAPSGS